MVLTGKYMERAVSDASDTEARSSMMWAAALAGSAFGNAGVHVPHGMSYSVAGMVKNFRATGYRQDEPLIPHGMSVIVNAPSAFRFTSPACPERHLKGAQFLGADVRDAALDDAVKLSRKNSFASCARPEFRMAYRVWVTTTRTLPA
jgi:hydroxyacid-oxoacid transhydrogenase